MRTPDNVNFRDVLEPDKADVMSLFLHELSRDAEKARAAGAKPDVLLFMRSWSGRAVSSVEKKMHDRERSKGWKSRTRNIASDKQEGVCGASR